MANLKRMVMGGRKANFQYYQGRNLVYKVGTFEFPIPIEDTGTGRFSSEMKAITLMRWIRKHLEEMGK